VLQFVQRHTDGSTGHHLAGSSVHVDLAFLRRGMPRLAAHMPYRVVVRFHPLQQALLPGRTIIRYWEAPPSIRMLPLLPDAGHSRANSLKSQPCFSRSTTLRLTLTHPFES